MGGSLQSPVHRPKNLPHMSGMVLHAGPTLNHFRHSRQGPQVGAKTVSSRPLSQRLLDLLELPAVQLRSAPGSPRSLQRPGSPALPLFVPTTHTLATHLQFTSDGRQDQLAGSEQPGGLSAPVFQPLKIPSRSNKGMHAHSVGYNETFVTALCEIQYARSRRGLPRQAFPIRNPEGPRVPTSAG
jgi:hypothetical protein